MGFKEILGVELKSTEDGYDLRYGYDSAQCGKEFSNSQNGIILHKIYLKAVRNI